MIDYGGYTVYSIRYMPKVTVYIRESDYDAWKKVINKAELVSKAINAQRSEMTPPTSSTSLNGKNQFYTKLSSAEITSPAKDSKIIKSGSTCPHGYGKGMCKRPDCNMKYRL